MKQHLNTFIIGLSIIIVAAILGSSYSSKYKQNQTISVTGLGEENFASDLIVWQANFSKRGTDLKAISAELNNDRSKIKKYLTSKGISEKDIVFSSVSITKEFSNSYDEHGNFMSSYFTGYLLTQNLRIESKEVDKIETVSREVTELIDQNIELTSLEPDYYYTKLAELKLKMIENATKDAKERAEKIASNSGSSLGNLRNASMGVIQITAKNSAEDYSWGGSFNTSSKLKTASITIRLEYAID
ncbi:SIMPL domain-containing protein [Crocinitomicaceae bacterium CZZ-1]|uniref:SIMPL domain-containing protein n=1 Tax=Taishania pollutisoli TaxID=2766479 RepID=A0A8J6PKU9_9FLAO|nr:SIMPL domain-containing protein [Taishania pollutisoli]MBC9813469.1 SIMPL domain-containing protein [Taishania pollutisoli]MBX2950644.1 SIMPL domain-containing protein [Crocinitomicaceae bacterium]NGF76491.1 SIMPL domain-containing protein [Fluviicola sp. SGL-29]